MDPLRPVRRLTGVYHADGGLRGELAYVVGKALGRAHCALCDVTHSPVRRKREWDAYVSALGVPFDLVHLNERSPAVAAATGMATPAVLAHVPGAGPAEDLVVVLGPADLDTVGGDVAGFGAALGRALGRAGLALP
ncbi:MAG: hypothetical protein R2737_00805 [Candidatus Nanopelagicales bacterium]